MHPHSWRNDKGSASLEFLAAGVLLLVPLLYLALTLGAVQSAALRAEGAARYAAQVFVEAPSPEEGAARARSAILFELVEGQLDPTQTSTTITCAPNHEECFTRDGYVTITVDVAVPIPLSPPIVDGTPASVNVSGSSTQAVSRFRARS